MRQHLQKELKIFDMLFNRNNNGSEELQKVTGNWMASADFSIISPEIISATEDVCRLVGNAVIFKAEQEYEFSLDVHPLLDAVRLPMLAITGTICWWRLQRSRLLALLTGLMRSRCSRFLG